MQQAVTALRAKLAESRKAPSEDAVSSSSSSKDVSKDGEKEDGGQKGGDQQDKQSRFAFGRWLAVL